MTEKHDKQGESKQLLRDNPTPDIGGWYCAVKVIDDGSGEGDPPDGKKVPPVIAPTLPEQKIVVGEGENERTLTVVEVEELLQGQATATQKSQLASSVLEAAEKYGLTPEEYIAQSEGMGLRFAELVQEGVLDEQGQVVKKTKPAVIPPKPLTPGAAPTPSDMKFQSVILKGLKSLKEENEGMKQDVNNLVRLETKRNIKKDYPEFDDDDVSRLFGQAKVDRDRGNQTTIYERAKELSDRKGGKISELRKVHAKEFGFDLENFDKLNALKQSDPKGGTISALKGKKIVFSPRGPNEISPADAQQAADEAQKRS